MFQNDKGVSIVHPYFFTHLSTKYRTLNNTNYITTLQKFQTKAIHVQENTNACLLCASLAALIVSYCDVEKTVNTIH